MTVGRSSGSVFAKAHTTSWQNRQTGGQVRVIAKNTRKKVKRYEQLVLQLASRKLKVSTVLIVRQLRQRNFSPEIRRKERISFGDSNEGSLQEVTHGGCRALRLRIAVLNTSELKHTLRCGRSDETSTTGCGDETTHDGADLAADF